MLRRRWRKDHRRCWARLSHNPTWELAIKVNYPSLGIDSTILRIFSHFAVRRERGETKGKRYVTTWEMLVICFREIEAFTTIKRTLPLTGAPSALFSPCGGRQCITCTVWWHTQFMCTLYWMALAASALLAAIEQSIAPFALRIAIYGASELLWEKVQMPSLRSSSLFTYWLILQILAAYYSLTAWNRWAHTLTVHQKANHVMELIFEWGISIVWMRPSIGLNCEKKLTSSEHHSRWIDSSGSQRD